MMLSRYPRRLDRAFTLTEIIVVIVVLGILAAISVPTFNTVKQGFAARAAQTSAEAIARDANMIINLKQLALNDEDAVEAAASETGMSNTSSPSWDSASNTVTVGSGSVTGSASVAFDAQLKKWVVAGSTVGTGGFGSGNVPATIIAKPDNAVVTVSRGAGGAVTLTWTVSATAEKPVTGFRVYVNNEQAAVVGNNISAYTFTDLTPGVSYALMIRPYNPQGEPDTITTGSLAMVTPIDIPAAPASVTVEAASSTSLAVSWTAVPPTESAPVDGYRLYQLNASSALYEMVAQTGSLTSTVSGLTSGTSYFFKVATYGTAGEGAQSAAAAGSPIGAPTPAAVTLVSAGSGSANISWTSTSTAGAPVTGFKVYRNGTLVGTLASSTSSFSFTGLTAGVDYTLSVKPFNTAGSAAAAAGDSVSLTALTVPDAPAGLMVAVNAASGSSLDASWDAVASTTAAPVVGYRVLKLNTGTGMFEQVSQTSSLTATVTGLTPGTEYSFRVAAYGDGGQGSASSAVKQTPVNSPAAPVLSVSPAGSGAADLSWTTADTAAAPVASFKVYKDGALLASVSSSTLTRSVTGLTPGTSYDFKVTALNPAGATDSGTISFTAVSTPAAPTGLVAAQTNTSGSLDLTWNTVSSTSASPVIGYRVFLLDTDTGAYMMIAQQAGTSYTTTGLTPG